MTTTPRKIGDRPAVNALRWILVLPGAAAGSFILQCFYFFILKISGGFCLEGQNRWLDVFLYLPVDIIGGFAFVTIGALIAPRGRKETTFTLAGLALVLGGFVTAGCVAMGLMSRPDLIRSWVWVIACVASAVYFAQDEASFALDKGHNHLQDASDNRAEETDDDENDDGDD